MYWTSSIIAADHHPVRRAVVLIVVSIAVPHLLLTIALPGVRAYDARAWESVVEIMRAHGNPYGPGLVVYPPFWIQVVDVLGRISDATGVSFNTLLRITLAAAEVGVAVVIYDVLRHRSSERSALRIVLVGLTLNPIVILLQTIHGNFDIIVALWVVLFLRSARAYEDSNDTDHWLLATLFVGMGILTKLSPGVLVPLLVPGFIAAGARARALGVVLTFGPVVLAMGVLFSINPTGARSVVSYNSIPGFFGITGILDAVHLTSAADLYVSSFRALLLAVLVVVAIRCARDGAPQGAQFVRAAVVLLAVIPVWGSGYGPQYMLWLIPPLVVLWPDASSAERRLCAALWIVGAITFIEEYAFLPSHGAFAFSLSDASWIRSVSDWASTPAHQTLTRLPLFIGLVTLTLVIGTQAWRNWQSHALPATEMNQAS